MKIAPWTSETIVINPHGEWMLKNEFEKCKYDGEYMELNVDIIGNIPYSISKKMEMNILTIRLFLAFSMVNRDHLKIFGMTSMTERCMDIYFSKRVVNEL